MGIAAKHLDPIVGIDMHMVQLPPPAPPVMLPIPFAGYLIDPNDYGSCKVRVNGFPPARAGTPGIACPPHIPPGGMFVKPPTNECEMHQGSSVVVIAGDAAAAQGNPVLTCHDVGMPAPVRAWRKAPAKSLMMAAANVLPIPGPSVVMINGAPTVSMSATVQEVEREDEKVLEGIEFEVYDAFGNPYADAPFELHLPNGDVEEGKLDANGYVKVDDVYPGYSLLVLPRWNDEPEAASGLSQLAGTKPRRESSESVGTESGGTFHRVVQGDTIRRIAMQHGIACWRKVYDHAANEELREARPDPNVILPGDIVHFDVPDAPSIEYREGGVAIRSAKRSVVHLAPRESIHLLVVAVPGDGLPTTARVNDETTTSEFSIASDGTLDFSVPMGARRVRIAILAADGTPLGALRLRLGTLDPISSPEGARSRLRNLGYPLARHDIDEGVRSFQKDVGLDPNGAFDDSTVEQLLDRHGT